MRHEDMSHNMGPTFSVTLSVGLLLLPLVHLFSELFEPCFNFLQNRFVVELKGSDDFRAGDVVTFGR